MNFCKTQTLQLSPVLSFQCERLTNTQTLDTYLSIPFVELLPKMYQAILTSSRNLGASHVGSSDFMWEDNHKVLTLQCAAGVYSFVPEVIGTACGTAYWSIHRKIYSITGA